MPERSSEIALIGVGPRGAASLDAEARLRVEGSIALAAGRRLLDLFPSFGGRRIGIGADLDTAMSEIEEASRIGGVSVLASGDPLFYSIGGSLIERFGAGRIRVFPQLSSIQLAFARIGMPYDDAAIVSVHGRPISSLAARLRFASKAAVLTDGQNTPSRVGALLLEDGQRGWRAWVCEALESPDERIVAGSLDEIAIGDFDPLNVLVLARDDGDVPRPPAAGLPDDAFERRGSENGMMTKFEVRAVAISALRLRPESIVWDIGAGSGSIAVEAAIRAREGTVYAFERDRESAVHIRANVERHRVPYVRVVEGAAPDVLAEALAPDAVFVGGSGGRLAGILDACKTRLRPRGRIVVSAATIETLTGAMGAFGEGWAVRTVQVCASRTAPVGGLTRLNAMNPVFLVTAQRLEEHEARIDG